MLLIIHVQCCSVHHIPWGELNDCAEDACGSWEALWQTNMSRIKSSLLNQKLGRKLKEYKWKYSAVLKAPCNCMPGINHGNSEPKFYLGNFPHELKSTAVDTGDNCWIWKRGVWAIGPVLCHRCEHIISPDKSWFEGKGWESVQWYTTPFLFFTFNK